MLNARKHVQDNNSQRKFPSMVANSVTKKTSYGLGYTTIDKETIEINTFPTCKRNITSNTKGSRNIPYSRQL